MGFDEPRSLGRHAYGSNLCGPVFNSFMEAAIKKYGAAEFRVPDGGVFVDVNAFTGEPVQTGTGPASSNLVIPEYFRFGSEPSLGELKVVDGGFVMGSDLKVYNPDETEADGTDLASNETSGSGTVDTDPDPLGQDGQSSFGALSSGGLY